MYLGLQDFLGDCSVLAYTRRCSNWGHYEEIWLSLWTVIVKQLILEWTRSRTVTKLSSSKSNWRLWLKRFICQLLSYYVLAQESLTPLICSVAMSLYDIISKVFYLSWHCANLYYTVWDSVLEMHGAHTISMLMHATHLRIYVRSSEDISSGAGC